MKKFSTFIICLLILAGLIWYGHSHRPQTSPQSGVPSPAGTIVSYACDAGKTITATFYDGPVIPPTTPDAPPTPTGTAHVILSDGRTFDLGQTISADGVRYATPDESFVFWSKGDGALVLENNTEGAYTNCTAETSTP
ncbi:MAG TPA: MliC family protein [Candidatus Paceibacterota bacterium]|nr:MliC family protein [Candidatus Paceibacterota bacterium]